MRRLVVGLQLTYLIHKKTDRDCIATYQRLLNTWQMYEPRIQHLLLANIRRSISARTGGREETTPSESTKALQVVEGDNYAEELLHELELTRVR